MASFAEFSVSRTYEDSSAQVVSGVLCGREVQVHYVEASGEFLLTASGSGAHRRLESDELSELADVLRRFHHNLPFVNGAAGTIMVGLDAALASALTGFAVRSVSELGHCILLTGGTPRGDVGIVYDVALRTLVVMEPCTGARTTKRPLSIRERSELRDLLEHLVARNLTPRAGALLREVLAAVATH